MAGERQNMQTRRSITNDVRWVAESGIPFQNWHPLIGTSAHRAPLVLKTTFVDLSKRKAHEISSWYQVSIHTTRVVSLAVLII